MAVYYIDDDLLIHKYAHLYTFSNGNLIHRECSIYKDLNQKDKAIFVRDTELPTITYGEVSLYPGEIVSDSLWLNVEDDYLAKQLLIQYKQKAIKDIYNNIKQKQAEIREMKGDIELLELDISLMK